MTKEFRVATSRVTVWISHGDYDYGDLSNEWTDVKSQIDDYIRRLKK